MPNPVFLDGPLKGQDREVSAELIEQGIYRAGPEDFYTFTRVHMFGRMVVTASVANGIPPEALLFSALVSERGQAAAE